MSTKKLADSVLESARRRVSGDKSITASTVTGLINKAIVIIQTEVDTLGVSFLVERTHRLTGVSITPQTIKRWLKHGTNCPQLNKLNSVLNACGYTLMIRVTE